MYYKAVRNDDDPDTQTVAAISLCKLLLAGIINEPDLVKTLVVVYFNGNSSYNQSLRQALTYCIPVYCFSSSENQKIMASVVVDSVRRLTLLYENADVEEMLNPTQILQQLIDWTNPSRVVRLNSSGQMAGGGGNDDVQCYVAIDMMNRLLDDKTPGKDERKALITGFSRLYIPDTTPLEQLKELFELVDEYVSEGDISEAYAKNAMQRFYNEIKGAIERAEQLLAVKPDEKEEEELVLIHSASENSKEDKEKDSKEVFEQPPEEPAEKMVTEDGTDPDRLPLVAESVAEVEAEEDNDIENVVANDDPEGNEEAKLEQSAPEAETSESENEDVSIQNNKNETYEDQDEKKEDDEDDDDDDELIPQVKKKSGSSRTTRNSRSTSRFSSRKKAKAMEEEDSKDKTTPNSKTSKDKLLLKRKSVSNDKPKSRRSSKTSKNAKYERPGKRQRTSGTKQDVPIEIDDSVGDSN